MGSPREVVVSAARTVTGSSGSLVIGSPGAATPGDPFTDEGAFLSVLVNVTAVTGTSPTMTLSVEWSMDGVTFGAADPADAFAAITAAGVKIKQFAYKAPYYRVVWTIGGTTPSFTFAVHEFAV